MTDDMGALDLERVHQPEHIGRHAVDGKAAARQIALSDAAMVMGDDVEILGEGGNLILPERGKPGQSRHEEDGKPDTLPLIIERAIADNDSRHRPASQNGTGVGIIAIGGCQTATMQRTHAAGFGVESSLCEPA
jgi:hypothetical protein